MGVTSSVVTPSDGSRGQCGYGPHPICQWDSPSRQSTSTKRTVVINRVFKSQNSRHKCVGGREKNISLPLCIRAASWTARSRVGRSDLERRRWARWSPSLPALTTGCVVPASARRSAMVTPLLGCHGDMVVRKGDRRLAPNGCTIVHSIIVSVEVSK